MPTALKVVADTGDRDVEEASLGGFRRDLGRMGE